LGNRIRDDQFGTVSKLKCTDIKTGYYIDIFISRKAPIWIPLALKRVGLNTLVFSLSYMDIGFSHKDYFFNEGYYEVRFEQEAGEGHGLMLVDSGLASKIVEVLEVGRDFVKNGDHVFRVSDVYLIRPIEVEKLV
jgi:hypothetical protein